MPLRSILHRRWSTLGAEEKGHTAMYTDSCPASLMDTGRYTLPLVAQNSTTVVQQFFFFFFQPTNFQQDWLRQGVVIIFSSRWIPVQWAPLTSLRSLSGDKNSRKLATDAFQGLKKIANKSNIMIINAYWSQRTVIEKPYWQPSLGSPDEPLQTPWRARRRLT